jgi:hypothetical protein
MDYLLVFLAIAFAVSAVGWFYLSTSLALAMASRFRLWLSLRLLSLPML